MIGLLSSNGRVNEKLTAQAGGKDNLTSEGDAA